MPSNADVKTRATRTVSVPATPAGRMREFDHCPKFIRQWLAHEAPTVLAPMPILREWRRQSARGVHWTKFLRELRTRGGMLRERMQAEQLEESKQ